MANIAHKSLSAVAVASLLAASAVVGVGAINSGATFLPAASAQTSQAIDGIPAEANLQIHKRLGTTTGDNADGTEIAAGEVPGDPAEGITFSAFPVDGIDLTTLEGWQAADDADINSFFTGAGPNSYSTLDQTGLGTEVLATSGVDGIAEFEGLDTGLYLVVEEANPTLEDGRSVAPGAPFLVTVPMTNPENRTEWLDTVHVYPKNQAVEQPSKIITDPVTTADGGGDADLRGSALNELIGYEISGTAPALGEGSTLNGFTITDKLPVGLSAPVAETIVVDVDGTALDVDTDYTVRNWTVTEEEGERQVLLLEFTDAGLEAIGVDGGVITTSFEAEVAAMTGASLENQAWMSPTALGVEDGWNPGVDEGVSPGTASNTTRSIYGEITIDKTGQDAAGDAGPLAGANFELHRCEDDDTLVADSLPIQVGGTTTWTTDQDGTASISGIHLANVTDQDDLVGTYTDLWADTGSQFCLVETEAPEGFALLPEPVSVTDLEYDETTMTLASVDQPIENVRNNAGFALPLTGGMGIWLVLGGGVLLLLIAAAYYLATRKRANA